MIKATYGLIRVQVISKHMLGDRPRLRVVADTGKPFAQWTHGGYCFTNATSVYPDQLKDKTYYPEEECTCRPDLPDGRCFPLCDVCKAQIDAHYGQEIPF